MNANSNPAGNPVIRKLGSKTSNSADDEFSTFEGLARKLVKVPKRALDDKRKAES